MSSGLTPIYSKTISKNFFLVYEEEPPLWRDIFHLDDMDAAFIDEQGWEGYQLPQVRLPGETVAYGQFRPSYPVRYVPRNYALGDVLPREEMDDDQMGVIRDVLPKKGGMFARSFLDLTENETSQMLINYGYSSGTIPFGPDQKSLFNTAHPVSLGQNGTTVANRPSTDNDFSIALYNAMRTNLLSQRYPNNLTRMHCKPTVGVFNESQERIARQVVQNVYERGTADRNQPNIAYQDAPKLIFWDWFAKSGTTGASLSPAANNAWFFLDGAKHMLKFFMRQALRIVQDSDSATNSEIFIGHMRCAYGWSDWRGSYGSTGS